MTAKILLAALAAGGVFYAGRASAPTNGPAPANARPTRSTERNSARVSPRGPSATPVSAAQLRALSTQGSGPLAATLERMTAAEVSALVHDLAATRLQAPGAVTEKAITAAAARWMELDPEAALDFILGSPQASFRSAALREAFDTLGRTDPALARASLARLTDPVLRRQAETQITTALAGTRPDEWVAAVTADPALANESDLAGIAATWVQDDPAAAAARMNRLSPALQRRALPGIAEAWAALDPAAAMAWAGSLKDESQRNRALGAVAGGLASRDPAAALASLDTLPPSARQAGLTAVFATLGDQDFRAAVARAAAIPEDADRNAAFTQLLSPETLSKRGAAELTDLLDQIPAGAQRAEALKQMGKLMAACSAEEAEKLLAACPEADREKLKANLVDQLTHEDPLRALAMYDRMAERSDDRELSRIGYYLSKQDPAAAFEMGMTRESVDEQREFVWEALSEMTKTDLPGARRLMDGMPPGDLRDNVINSFAKAYAQQDPGSALAWAGSLEGEEKTDMLHRVIKVTAETDPVGTAARFSSLLAAGGLTGDKDQGAAGDITGHWAVSDPAAACAWVATLPDGAAKTSAVDNLVNYWHGQDMTDAGTWLNTLPAGAARDSGAGRLAQKTWSKDPAAAFEWAASISDSSGRDYQLGYIVSMNTENKDAARAAIENAALTPERRAALLEKFSTPGRSTHGDPSDPFAR